MGQSLSYSIVTLAEDATTITKQLLIYYNTTAGVTDSSNSFNATGDWVHSSTAVNIDVPFGGGSQLIYGDTQVFAKTYGATPTKSFSASLSGINYWGAGNTIYASGSTIIPARAYDIPAAPTSVVAARTSDTSTALTWVENATVGAPYDSQAVWVSIDGATAVFVANVLASAENYTYVSAGNHKYIFTIKASNGTGTTSSAVSNTILTTPAVLPTLTAAVIVSGTIRVTLPIRPTPYTEGNVVIEETHNAGVDWNAVTTLALSSLSTSTTTTYDDTSAETSGTTTYRARVVTTGGTQGVLSSANTESNTLVLNTPPLAPTNLTPSGSVDASQPIRLAWEHTPSSDGAAQSSRKLEYSTDGGSSQTSIVIGNSTVAYYDWSPTLGSFTAGQTILWRGATAGSQPGTYGAWSTWQTLTLYGGLAVTLLTDNPPTTHAGGPLPVAWSSSATWGTASQTQYQLTMTDQGSGETVFDSGAVTTTDEATTIPSSLQLDGHVYTVELTLTDNHQLESVPVSRTVTMDYLAPGAIALTWLYDDESGQLVFYPDFSPETSSIFDDTYSWTLERSIDGGAWVDVGTAVGEFSIADPIAQLGAESRYRTTSFTELGVAGEPTIHTVPAIDVVSRWGWLNFGDDYQSWVRFGWSQTIDISAGRASQANDIEGVEYPVAVFGEPLSDKRAITGKLLYGDAMPTTLATSTDEEMMAMSKTAAVAVFRDARGAWYTARVTDMKVSPGPATSGPQEARVSFTVERVTA